jgi:hypothetical protein
MPSADNTEPALPKYVFQLGQLYVKDLAAPSTAPVFQRTNFVAVIDATTPKKPLWLMYDSSPENNLLGERQAVALADQGEVFQNVKIQFDSAQVMASLQDWKDNLTVEAVEASISQTGRVVKLYAGTVDYSEVATAVQQGWRSQ